VPDRALNWYGRSHPSELTGKAVKELWGLSFGPFAHGTLEEACRWYPPVEPYHDPTLGSPVGRRAWGAFRRATGQDLHRPVKDFSQLVEIDDWTEDFDSPIDFDTWRARREAWRKASTPG